MLMIVQSRLKASAPKDNNNSGLILAKTARPAVRHNGSS